MDLLLKDSKQKYPSIVKPLKQSSNLYDYYYYSMKSIRGSVEFEPLENLNPEVIFCPQNAKYWYLQQPITYNLKKRFEGKIFIMLIFNIYLIE